MDYNAGDFWLRLGEKEEERSQHHTGGHVRGSTIIIITNLVLKGC